MSDIERTEGQQEMLTVEQVNEVLNAWDFLEFANSYKSSYYNDYLTPDLVNQQMKNINMNPVNVTVEGIERALSSPKESEGILRNYAQSTELQNMYYKRLVRYIPDMAAFNITFDVKNIEKDSELNSKAFKDDMKILDRFCSRFNFKEEFQTVLRQLMRQGVFYGILRTEGEKYTLQELPPDFCKITGRHDYGLLFDFDMQWFMNYAGVDINMYPKVFKKMYRDVFNKVSKSYNPAKPVDKRNSTFVYWHNCSPSDGFWAWKISPEVATIVPYYSPLFADISMQPVIRGLQNDKYFIEASKLLVGIIGFNKENKSGNVANQINITPDMLGKFLGVARQGLSKQIGLVALPVDDIKAVEFETADRNILSDYTSNVSKQGSASSDPLFSTNKLNTHQSKLAAAIDMNFLYSLYPMFADFVEYYVNSLTTKYKFKIEFNDANTPDNYGERKDAFKLMSSMGMVDIQQAARVCNLNPFDFSRRLSLTSTFGLDKKLMPINQLIGGQNANGGVSGQPGRPAKPDSDNDNTQASIARGSNEDKVT